MTDTKTVYHDAGVDPMDTQAFLRSPEYETWLSKNQQKPSGWFGLRNRVDPFPVPAARKSCRAYPITAPGIALGLMLNSTVFFVGGVAINDRAHQAASAPVSVEGKAVAPKAQ